MNDQNNNFLRYQILDKDYGRVLLVGSGYGELDLEQYKKLEELAK